MVGALIGVVAGAVMGVTLTAILSASRDTETASWIDQLDELKPHYGYYKCSCCDTYSERAFNYCPVCGRFMTKVISGKEFPVAEGMSVICSVFFYTRIYKNIIKNIPDPSDHKEVAVS